jgi:predicted RNA-binding protein YlqC (UPF0109 family)
MENENGARAMVMLVREMVRAMVDDQESVKIAARGNDGYVIVNVTVASSDIGKLIGKQGRTARSLRTILAAASMKCKVRCELNIVEAGNREEGVGSRKQGAA